MRWPEQRVERVRQQLRQDIANKTEPSGCRLAVLVIVWALAAFAVTVGLAVWFFTK